jgi:beta-alanine degradation protein BauB
MTRLFKTSLALAGAVGLLSSAFGADAQEVSQAAPAGMRIELENPSMVVLRIVLGPREKTGMHDVTPRLVIWLTEAHLRDAMADGSMRHYDRAAGTVEWVPAQRHAGENLSDKPIEFLAVVPKQP